MMPPTAAFSTPQDLPVRKHGGLRSLPGAGLFAFALLAGLTLGMRSAEAQVPAQGRSLGNLNFGGSGSGSHGPAERLVQGVVRTKDGKAQPGALVYLKNIHTASVAVMVADDKGAYRFGPLPSGVDYEIWVKAGDKKSATKPISEFSDGAITMPMQVE